MNEQIIDVVQDFSRYPAGRSREDGRYSGEAFRDDLLYPAILEGNQIQVKLDTTAGYGSSFLEEAFGGLVREKGLSVSDVERHVVLLSLDQYLIDEIWHYVHEAVPTGSGNLTAANG